jgi:glutamate---cysteine ligase / carboxylate-amine ligase
MNVNGFPTYGIEIEYMIVDEESLDVRPIADRLLAKLNDGRIANEVVLPPLAVSNELPLHVIELKTDWPVPEVFPMAGAFHKGVAKLNGLLVEEGARLLPGGMHPWMAPERDTRLWPHGDREIYNAFDRIFDCRGHGWSNLQSSHLNLPFHDDASFAALHHAIRLVLPLLPAIAASSPVVDGQVASTLDRRLKVYRTNCAKLQTVTGEVIPEPVDSPREYHERILAPMYCEIAPHDPEGVLREEWLNARGAIARFDRNTIEIRVLDVQECAAADLAIHVAVSSLVRHLEKAAPLPQELLVALYEESVEVGFDAKVPGEYAALFGLQQARQISMRQLWEAILSGAILNGIPAEARKIVGFIVSHGSLAERILRSLNAVRGNLRNTYRQLANSLASGKPFFP